MLSSKLRGQFSLTTLTKLAFLFSLFLTQNTKAASFQPIPSGWYINSDPPVIYEGPEQNSELKVTWEGSYIYPYPAGVPLYWYARAKYLNTGSQTLSFHCAERDDPLLAKEYMRGKSGDLGYVAADETYCSHNPNLTYSLKPGDSYITWAIFHNVPWADLGGEKGEVFLEWGRFGSSPYIYPWKYPAPYNVPSPSVCPPELVALSICQPGQSTGLYITKQSASEEADIGGMVLYTIDVKNNSDTDATNVNLDDKLPAELWPLITFCSDNKLTTFMATQGTCNYTDWSSLQNPIKVHCDLGDIAAGNEASVSYAVQIMDELWVQPKEISNIVTVQSDQLKPATVKTPVNLVRGGVINDNELNETIDSIRKCPLFTTNLPFLDLVNLYIDQLQKGEITSTDFHNSLFMATLELLDEKTKNAAFGFLNDLFYVENCLNYVRLLLSIPGHVNSPTQCAR
jgi:uncharacterized repeat protein (TIGR01451 family)